MELAMIPSGQAPNISRQEANDLLYKLITENTPVQAMFAGRGSVTVALQGIVSFAEEGLVMVSERKTVNDAYLYFGLRDVRTFKYGDARLFGGNSSIAGT